MPIQESDILINFTSSKEEGSISDPGASIGGYFSSSSVYAKTTLASNFSGLDDGFTLTSSSGLTGAKYLLIGSELVEVFPVDGNEVTVFNRGLSNTPRLGHLSGAVVRRIEKDQLFDNDFSNSLKQYRCFAVKNNSASDSLGNVRVFIKSTSPNPFVEYRIAIEAARTDSIRSTATSATALSISDSSIANSVPDNFYKGRTILITSGPNTNERRIIASFDGETGTFVFDSSLPTPLTTGTTYLVGSSPSQRIAFSTLPPDVDNDFVSEWQTASSPSDAIDINIKGNRQNASTMKPGDVVYVWVERSLMKNTSGYKDSGFVIAMRWEDVL
jgi:hypothetical protein